ncbi:hypothetical protein FA13DRAFT_1790069 [Coprinellus micaceus]|uniref:Uncharacterized protein n=1 Tax=Coprinellus micaceus TaxID=71717 RepID=A0A4Y7TFP0_COPMI|nr:hypothetical protein FA13DRAFT_1790069 [Coprinellus micaceus]
MTLLPFSLSYLVMTPGRVRLPGETPKRQSTPPSPSSPNRRWSTDIRTRATSFNRRLSVGLNRPSRSLKGEIDSLIDHDEREDPPF